MTLFLQLVVDGLTSGSIYGALALALVLIFRATSVVNFGQGEMATFCVYCAWQMTGWGVPLWLALALGLVASFMIGMIVFRVAIRPLVGAPVESMVVVTLGLLLLFQALSLWNWGATQQVFPSTFPAGGFDVGGVRVRISALGTTLALLAMALGIGALFRFTRLGLAMQAAAYDGDKSRLVGNNVERMLMLGWGLAAAIGFVAAALVAPRLFLSPPMMLPILFYGLAAATLGGWDSPLGAIVGGLLLGITESVGAAFLPFIGADLRIAVPIGLTLLILLLRPEGFFGSRAVVKL